MYPGATSVTRQWLLPFQTASNWQDQNLVKNVSGMRPYVELEDYSSLFVKRKLHSDDKNTVVSFKSINLYVSRCSLLKL